MQLVNINMRHYSNSFLAILNKKAWSYEVLIRSHRYHATIDNYAYYVVLIALCTK